jgi:lipoate-protein ligase A
MGNQPSDDIEQMARDVRTAGQKLTELASSTPEEMAARRKEILRRHDMDESCFALARILKEKGIDEKYFQGWSKSTWKGIAITLAVIDALYFLVR